MASQGFYEWGKAGRPYTLIRPARALQAVLRGHGLTVFDFPNDAHLRADPPEDHTPFSVTGFPGPNKRWHARAIDIMPRSGSAAHRRENADIARQLIKDRDAGVPNVMWIKYINWTAEDGTCQQERWTSAGAPLKRTTKSSTDDGHIHVSGRSDADDDTRAEGYDPIARMGSAEGGDMGDTPLAEGAAWRLDALAAGLETVRGGPTKGEPMQIVRDVHTLQAAAAADQARDQALLVAVQALSSGTATGGPLELAPVLAAISAVRADTLAAVQQLQQELTAERARGAQLVAALAAAGASLQTADDPPA